MFVWILRALTSITLGLVFFLSLVLLLVSSVASALTDGSKIADSLSDQDVYGRIYSEVLTPDIVGKHRKQIFGEGVVLSSAELHQVLRRVALPTYAKEQTELNLNLFAYFLASEQISLHQYLDLGEFRKGLAPAMTDLVRERDYAALQKTSPSLKPQLLANNAVDRYFSGVGRALESIVTGGDISTLPADLTGLTGSQTGEIFDKLMESLHSNANVERPYKRSLREAEPDLRRAFTTGGTSDLLAQATSILAKLDAKTADENVQRHLDYQGRLDLVPLLAGDVLDTNEEQLQESARNFRQGVRFASGWVRNIAIALVVLTLAAAIVMYRKSPAELMRWLCWTLILSGAASLALVLLAYLTIPNAVEALVYEHLSRSDGLISAFAPLASALADTLIKGWIAGLIWLAALPLAAGAALWAVLAVWSRRQGARAKSWHSHLAPDDRASMNG